MNSRWQQLEPNLWHRILLRGNPKKLASEAAERRGAALNQTRVDRPQVLRHAPPLPLRRPLPPPHTLGLAPPLLHHRAPPVLRRHRLPPHRLLKTVKVRAKRGRRKVKMKCLFFFYLDQLVCLILQWRIMVCVCVCVSKLFLLLSACSNKCQGFRWGQRGVPEHYTGWNTSGWKWHYQQLLPSLTGRRVHACCILLAKGDPLSTFANSL